MKSFTPAPGVSTSRTFLASLLTCIILVTPLAPVGYASTNTSRLVQTRSKSGDKQQTAPKTDTPTQAGRQKETPVTSSIAASDITATKTDAIAVDTLNDGKAQAGDIINYTITVNNNSTTETATGVVLNDTIDSNTTIVTDSIHAQPQARNDVYNAVGNTLLEAGLAAPSGNPAVTSTVKVFDNDSAATDPSTLVSFQNPSAQNGTVTLNADGSFSYLPAVGFTGTDTFTYTVRNSAAATLTDTATVTITVANRVWYVNNAAAAGGDGRSSTPYQTLAQVNGAGGAGDSDSAGDYIYLFTGNANYTTGLVLESDQKLVGNGVALVVNGNTLRAAGTRPTLSNGAGNALTLANNTNTQGLNLTAAANAAIFGSGTSGTINVSDAGVSTSGTGTGVSLTNQGGTFNFSGGGSGSSITGNSSGTGIIISGGNGNITFSGVPLNQTGGRAVDIQTRAGGTVSFENGSPVTETNGSTDAIVLRNNTGGSVINFSNNVNLTTNAGRGLFTDNSTGNFTLNMNAAGNAINATGGAAIDVEDIIADLDFVTLASTNSVVAGGSQGVRIFNITGSVTVTTSTTVSNSAGTGVGVQSSNATVAFATLNSAPAAGQIAVLVQTNSGTTSATGGTVTATDAAAVSVLNSPLSVTLGSVSADNTGDSDPAITLNGMTGTLVMQGGALVGGNAQAFLANAQNGSITYNGTISQANAFRTIEVTNKTGGTVNFGGQITATNGAVAGAGVFLNANGNTTFNFTGGLNLSTLAGDAFTATGGGTVNVTQNNTSIVNTLTTTTGTALNVTNTNIGASGLTFRSINSIGIGAKNGVILNTTGTAAGTNGGLTITGNGGTCGAVAATCTGGNIANKTSGADASATEGTGIYLKDTRDVNLTNVFLNDFANYAIYGNNVTNFTFTTSRVTGSNGTSSNPINEGCIRFDGLLGNALITGSNIGNTNTAGGATNALHVNNASGTLTLLDIQNSTIFNQNGSSTPANSGQDAVFFGSPSGATGVMNLRMNNSSLTHARQFLLQVNIQGTKTSNLEITNNTLHNLQPLVVNAGGGSNITGGGTDVYVKYTISGNSFRHTPGVTNGGRSMTIGHASGNAAFDGRFINNTIGQTGVVASGAGNAADALGVFASGNNSPTQGGSKALIQGNTIQRYGEAGILVNARQGNATLDVTILGNIIREPGTAALGAFAGIWVNSGALPADTNIVNVVIGSATVAANKNTLTNTDPSNATDVFLDKNTCGGCASQLRLYQNGSDAAGATIEDKVRDVLNDDNIGPLDLLAGFTNASAITLVAAGLPAQPTVVNIAPDDSAEGQSKNDPAAAHEAAIAAAARAVPVRSDLTGANAPVFIGAPVVAAQPVAVNNNDAQAASGVKQDQDTVSKTGTSKTPEIQPAVSTFPINLGDIGPSDSVTIIFSVKIADVLPQPVSEISNQGQITGTNFAGTVLTDDPSIAGANNPTVTPILGLPNVEINNASAAEPTSGSAPMPFTVALSHAYGAPVSVSFSTADSTATAGTDYTATSGTLNFASGERVQTINVPVLSDGDAGESDETFTVTLNTPVNAYLGMNPTATGTITVANAPGTVLISELRTSGPAGADDEFVELYNNTDAPIDISGWAVATSGATCGGALNVVAVVPAATTIPARGHYLFTGSGYSLPVTGDQVLTTPIDGDANVGIFDTSDVINFSTTTRRDAVGFGTNTLGNCALLREGANLPAAGGSTSEHSFTRKMTTGFPQDTNDSAADFILVTTTPAVPVGSTATPILGAPGAENLASPVQRNAAIKSGLINPMVASTAPPNRVRSSFGANPTNAAFGTLSIQRRFKNTLGAAVTRLRFRVVDLTTINNRTAGQSDLRVLSSTGVVTDSAGNTVVTVNGLTLEAPAQPNGGGLNSTLTVVLPGGGLAPGNTIDVQFLLGVQEQGQFSFFVNVEALPGLGTTPSEATRSLKAGTTAKQRSADTGGAATQKQ